MNDLRHKGKMILANATVYDGCFKNDEFFGLGTLTYPDGTILTAMFTSSTIPLISKIYFPDF